jgi:hypothetical protein
MEKTYNVIIEFHGYTIEHQLSFPDSFDDGELYEWITSDISIDFEEV